MSGMRPRAANNGSAAARCAGVVLSKSSMPLGDMNALRPTTPASSSAPSSVALSALCGTRPPQKATSTCSLPRAAASLRANSSAVTVVGKLLSGMSTHVVTPPAAAARVAVEKPSQSARPGSFMCTCRSTRPGLSTAEL